MGWLGRLVGTEKAVDDILDKDTGHLAKLGAWFGNYQFTEEEQAENNNLIREQAVKQLSALEPFKIMQRILVTIIAIEWAILLNCIILCIMFQWQVPLENLIKFAGSQYAWYPMGAAVTLYLMGGVWKGKTT